MTWPPRREQEAVTASCKMFRRMMHLFSPWWSCHLPSKEQFTPVKEHMEGSMPQVMSFLPSTNSIMSCNNPCVTTCSTLTCFFLMSAVMNLNYLIKFFLWLLCFQNISFLLWTLPNTNNDDYWFGLLTKFTFMNHRVATTTYFKCKHVILNRTFTLKPWNIKQHLLPQLWWWRWW